MIMTTISQLQVNCTICEDWKEAAVAYSAICSEEPKKTTKNLRIEYLRRKM
jgi:hypothetical protein